MKEQAELTIEQLQDVLGWAYPKALRYAQEHGRRKMRDSRKKWLVPYELVEAQVNERVLDACRSRVVLQSYNGQ
jgi:hypothetical protein